ncbi:hypothetical protein ACIQNG_25585 [Streptomyces sp. NPDC091377]|uniref:hypothetical protein n=1 Tax=Streptomyces sp. NPDC091377 TaxID=3365995 RepID=UPI003814B149
MTMQSDRADVRDQQIADLRDALALAVRWIAYSAGQQAADDPMAAEQLMHLSDDLEAVLSRTAPQ